MIEHIALHTALQSRKVVGNLPISSLSLASMQPSNASKSVFKTGRPNEDLILGNTANVAMNSNKAGEAATFSIGSVSGFGVDKYSLGNLNYGTMSNESLVDQKLRNSGLYTKLKNKTMYSMSSLAHANLNSGIL